MQFDVQFYLRPFERREMLPTAQVLAKASCFTIANASDMTVFSISEELHIKEGTCLIYLWATRKSCQQEAGALTAGAGGFFRAGRHWLCTQLTKAVSPIERDSVSRWKRAPGDRKTLPSRLFQQYWTSFLYSSCSLPPGANSFLWGAPARMSEMQS